MPKIDIDNYIEQSGMRKYKRGKKRGDTANALQLWRL